MTHNDEVAYLQILTGMLLVAFEIALYAMVTGFYRGEYSFAATRAVLGVLAVAPAYVFVRRIGVNDALITNPFGPIYIFPAIGLLLIGMFVVPVLALWKLLKVFIDGNEWHQVIVLCSVAVFSWPLGIYAWKTKDRPLTCSSPLPSAPSRSSAKGWSQPAFSQEEMQILRTVPKNQLPPELRKKAEEHGLTDRPDHKPAL